MSLPGPEARAGEARVRVWDLPIRLVHGLFVLLIATSWWTAENGWMEYHRYSGYCLLGVLAFRIYWGFAGSTTARFASFVKGPRAVWVQTRQLFSRVTTADAPDAGHNALGAVSVVLLLALMAAQVTVGLFAVDVDGIESGPLSHLVSFDAGRDFARVHHQMFDALWILILVHVVAVLFYVFYRRRSLIAPMITGRRREPLPPGVELRFAGIGALLAGIALAAATAWFIANGLSF